MEKELFDWETWDDCGMTLAFGNCTLKQAIGTHKVGEVMPCINWDQENGLLELVIDPDNDVIEIYKVKLTIVGLQ